MARPASTSAASACTSSACRCQCRRFSWSRARRTGSRSTATTAAPAAASCAVFPPGAAQRSAMRSPARAASSLAGSAAAASCTQNSPRSKPARSVTWVPTGKRTEPVGNRMPPGGSVAEFGRDVERRLALMGDGDLARLVPPRRPEPGRRVQPRSVQIRQRRRARLGHTTENGIDHARERRQPTGARQCDRGRDRGVARRVQQQQPGGAQPQHMARRLGRRLAQERLQHRVQCSHPPQHRRRQPMRRRPIPRRDGGKRVQRLLERPAAIENRGQQIESSLTRRVGHQRAVARQATSRPCSRQRAST